MTTLAELRPQGEGALVTNLAVQVVQAYVPKTFPSKLAGAKPGDTFTVQNLVVQDTNGDEFRLSVTDPLTPLSRGDSIVVSAYKDGKGKWGGASTKTYNNNLEVKCYGRAVQVVNGAGNVVPPAAMAHPTSTATFHNPGPTAPHRGGNGGYPPGLQMPGELVQPVALPPGPASFSTQGGSYPPQQNATQGGVQTANPGGPATMPEVVASRFLVRQFRDIYVDLLATPDLNPDAPELIEAAKAMAITLFIQLKVQVVAEPDELGEALF